MDFQHLSKAMKKDQKKDIQKALDILAGRKVARFKRLTAEEKEARARELQQTPTEKLHRNFQIYKIPQNIIQKYLNWLYYKVRKWHVHVSRHSIDSAQMFSVNDIHHLFFDWRRGQ